jgi:diacylglycerol kinase family enzyme
VWEVDAGRLVRDGARGRAFVHAATAGLNVDFARLATRTGLRRRLGRLSYAVAAIGAFRRWKPFECSLDYGNGPEAMRLIHLSVINAPVFGGILGLEMPGVDPLDSRLDLLLVEELPLRRFLRSLFYPVLGVRRRIRGIEARKVGQLRVEAGPEVEVTLDGEVCGPLRGTFEVVPGALRVIVPAYPNSTAR